MIHVAQPYMGLGEETAAILVLRSGRLVQGPEVEGFEADVAEYCEVRHAVACSSGTTALHLALMGMGVGPGHRVLVPAFTFVATANVVLACGAVPVLCDINADTFNIDIASNQTAYIVAGCVITVHAFGVLAEVSGNDVLEDAACALGSFKGLRGRAATLSFHATKTITTGEGGMVLTDDADLAARCRFLRDQKHGQGMAYNYRMTEVQGAIGRVQMTRLPWMLSQRAEIAAAYDAALNDLSGARIPPKGGNYQSYVMLLAPDRNRAAVIAMMRLRSVEALPGTQFLGDMPHLRSPDSAWADIERDPNLGGQGRHPKYDKLPNARFAGTHAMRIPIWPGMTDAEVGQVINAVREVLG